MPIPLAIVWHQHQPYYKDLASGEMVLPWVRLHGIKDYYGMARLISEFPGVKCTINLVPSMLSQLVDYVEKDASDPYLRRTVMDADALSSEDACFVLDHFFMAQWDRMIRVHPRFRELLDLRHFGRRAAQRALHDFRVQDLRDLQVWFNLAWFHPVSFEESETLRELRKKQRGFSESDKAAMLREQKRVLARVIPLHQELAARKQVELTTTPFYHPILPLLCDMKSCQAAMPRNPLPSGHLSLAEDAEMQIKKAVEYHRHLFGVAPEGMWPSEGSVSPDIVPLIARHGIKWIATDEEILAHSLRTRLRGGFGKLEHPEHLYRAWNYEVQGAKLNVLFRDHHLSDLVGFQYQGWEGATAAEDFLQRVHASAHEAPAGAETLVSVILDGENCWEHYPDQGVQFLRSLYAKLEKNSHTISSVRVSDFLNTHPPQRRLETIFPGSWINHDFYIWVGHSEDRRAWEYVYRVREDLVAATRARGTAIPDDMGLAHAWEELYIAEGSDWYWWYGDDHTSGNDDAFDTLFRTHLKNVYKFIGQPAPHFLNVPVKGGARAGRYTSPTASLQVKIDGRCTNYFEWLCAGRYRADKEGGVMTAAHASLLDQVYFGYDQNSLCLRIDLHDEPLLAPAENGADAAQKPRHMIRQLNVHFPDLKLVLGLHPADLKARNYEGKWDGAAQLIEAAWDEIVELKVPFTALGVKEGQDLAFYVEVAAADRATERYPRNSALQFAVPPANVQEHEWMA